MRRRLHDLLLASGPARTLTLAAAGAVVGLGIAGAALFTAKGTRTAVVPPEDAAIVNHVPILMSDYIVQLRALYDVSLSEATPAQRRQVLDDMIREELTVQRGVELGLQTDDIDVRRTLVGAVEGQVAADAAASVPDERELRDYYDTHRSSFTEPGSIMLEDYRVPAGRDAAAVSASLRRGISPAALGLADTGRVKGLEFDWAARLHLPRIVYRAALALPAGRFSEPIAAPDGTHILHVTRRVAPVLRPFDEVRPNVVLRYRAELADRIRASNDRFLRRRADVQVAGQLR